MTFINAIGFLGVVYQGGRAMYGFTSHLLRKFFDYVETQRTKANGQFNPEEDDNLVRDIPNANQKYELAYQGVLGSLCILTAYHTVATSQLNPLESVIETAAIAKTLWDLAPSKENVSHFLPLHRLYTVVGKDEVRAQPHDTQVAHTVCYHRSQRAR